MLIGPSRRAGRGGARVATEPRRSPAPGSVRSFAQPAAARQSSEDHHAFTHTLQYAGNDANIILELTLDDTKIIVTGNDRKSGEAEGGRWLILFYQVPPKPPYLRVKISRRLGKVGALAVKPTVYVLPKSDGALEDFQWVARELSKEGGDATVCEARLVEGLSDDLVERMFNEVAGGLPRDPAGGPRAGERLSVGSEPTSNAA